jgi:hypothetical protein
MSGKRAADQEKQNLLLSEKRFIDNVCRGRAVIEGERIMGESGFHSPFKSRRGTISEVW